MKEILISCLFLVMWVSGSNVYYFNTPPHAAHQYHAMAGRRHMPEYQQRREPHKNVQLAQAYEEYSKSCEEYSKAMNAALNVVPPGTYACKNTQTKDEIIFNWPSRTGQNKKTTAHCEYDEYAEAIGLIPPGTYVCLNSQTNHRLSIVKPSKTDKNQQTAIQLQNFQPYPPNSYYKNKAENPKLQPLLQSNRPDSYFQYNAVNSKPQSQLQPISQFQQQVQPQPQPQPESRPNPKPQSQLQPSAQFQQQVQLQPQPQPVSQSQPQLQPDPQFQQQLQPQHQPEPQVEAQTTNPCTATGAPNSHSKTNLFFPDSNKKPTARNIQETAPSKMEKNTDGAGLIDIRYGK